MTFKYPYYVIWQVSTLKADLHKKILVTIRLSIPLSSYRLYALLIINIFMLYGCAGM